MIVMDGFGWSGGSGWVMGQWSVGQWMVGVMSYQKKYGLNSTKCHKVEKISGSTVFGWGLVGQDGQWVSGRWGHTYYCSCCLTNPTFS